MRSRMYTLIHKAEPGDRLSRIYDYFIVAVAFISVVPLMFKTSTPLLKTIDLVTVYILFADYIFHWLTCERSSRFSAPGCYIAYPFTPYGLVVLASLLPSMGILSEGWRLLRMLRLFVVLSYSENFQYIARVFKKERRTLLSVLYLAVFYIFVSALAMFAYEPDSFESFFEALYWSTTALTTVGYGDISPATGLGRLVSMVSSLFGIAVIALPAGIVTAGFVDEINAGNRRRKEARGAAEAPKTAAKGPLLRVTPKVRRYLVVMAASVALNAVLARLAEVMNWPVWLDTTGTIFAAVALEPAAGLVVGLVDNMVLAITEYGVASLLYFGVSAAVALIAGLCLRKNGRITPRSVALTLALLLLASTVLSAGIGLVIGGAAPPDSRWERHFYDIFAAGGLGHPAAFFLSFLVVKCFDTLACALVVGLLLFALWRWLPEASKSEPGQGR